MSEPGSLEALQALHRDLLALCEYRFEGLECLAQSLEAQAADFKKLLDKPSRKKESRDAVSSGTIKVFDEDYSINKDFQETALRLADELDLDEVEAAKVLLEAEGDLVTLGRPLVECGMIRFHQQRKYVLDCIRLCLRIAADEDIDNDIRDGLGKFVEENVFGVPLPMGDSIVQATKFLPRCMETMLGIRNWLTKLSDKLTAAALMLSQRMAPPLEMREALEFSRISLIQQHELLATIMFSAVEKKHAGIQDFQDFLGFLKKVDRYDSLLIHFLPVLGAYITLFGPTERTFDLRQVRNLDKTVCKRPDDDAWTIPTMDAMVRAWWLAEYSGWYVDDPIGSPLEGVDLDEEDKERAKQFLNALRDGAFDFMLSIAADVKSPEWQDPTKATMHEWLQRKSPNLPPDSPQFSDFFQTSLMTQLEVFIDAFITNLPDVLRKMRVDEDEQRQLSQAHEQDLDLERFLIIIAYAYEGRPEAAETFWSDPDSNLAGFVQWASRRASTPLVSAFCEMLQAISEDEQSATAAHEFLLDEGHHSSGKLRRSLNLRWSQIFKELLFFSNKIRERPPAPQTQMYRAGKPNSELAETEPESAMMLECYLRLITKLASQSESARQFLLIDPAFNLVEVLYQLASSIIPPRLRACVFYALRSLLSRKTLEEGYIMWQCLDSWMSGGYATPQGFHRVAPANVSSTGLMEAIFEEIGNGFDEPNAFIHFLTALTVPVDGYSPLNDGLPFPENMGSATRTPGIDLYVDFVLGHVFSHKTSEVSGTPQLRLLRLSCLEFALTCLSTFNEDLIIIGNETNVKVDAAISSTDLATYVRLHPFARVMEWMFNDRVIDALFRTIHQDAAEVGNSAPDAPLLLGILRSVETISKVLDLQATYLSLVRPIVKTQTAARRQPVANASFASFEDGLMRHVGLVVDLGSYCGIGIPDLTLACLKLLEKLSSSSRVISAWQPGGGRHAHRNKAIVALESNGEAETIAGSLIAELTQPLDLVRQAQSSNYMIKLFILDFLYECLRAAPDQPTIGHLLLGFKCGANSISIEPRGSFDVRTSLFHNLIRVFLETPFGDELSMRQWLITLKYKTLRILQILWRSPLSSSLVTDELRDHDIIFHLLLREIVVRPSLPWDQQDSSAPEFLLTEAAIGYVDFLSLRFLTFDYMATELCRVSQNRLQTLKRRIFDALNGRIVSEENEPMTIPTVFDLYDFLPPDGYWSSDPPQLDFYKDLDIRTCLEDDAESTPIYNIGKVKEILLLKRNEARSSNQVITAEQFAAVDFEEAQLLEFLVFDNRRKQMVNHSRRALKGWTSLLLVMFESNEFKGTARVSFLLQALQSILPSLERYSSESFEEAFELAKIAKVLLFKLDFEPPKDAGDKKEPHERKEDEKESRAVGHLVSDKLFQLFQICLQAIGRWAGNSELRAMYYSICYRYLAGAVGKGEGNVLGRQKAAKTVQMYGERLLSVICDDALSSDPGCQTAALILLGALVNLGKQEADQNVVESLNRLNFIGVLVDLLRNILNEGLDIIQTGNVDQEQFLNAKLVLLLQLCQNRVGAKYVLHANLFRAIEMSGLFSADPELQIDPSNTRALEKHYSLLVRVTRVIGAAIVSRGAHNVLQGRKFLADHRMLIMHVLKRSAGIGAVDWALTERVEDLAEAFMVIITATGFLEFETQPQVERKQGPILFH